MYVNSLVCLRVKGGVSEWFRMDSGVRKGCIMYPWVFNAYINAVLKEVKKGMERRELDSWVKGESGDYLASCMEITWFCVVSRRGSAMFC